MSEHTPIMQQFFRAKAQCPDAIVFFRLGDFYEMFFDDAVVGANLLDLTLTSRGHKSNGEKIPMAGVPQHSATSYIAKLLEKGHKVALCEQMGDPSKIKGIVPREVVQIMTPGLCAEPDALEKDTSHYLVVVFGEGNEFALAALELSTGELFFSSFSSPTQVATELARLEPKEVLLLEEATALEALLRTLLPHALVSNVSKEILERLPSEAEVNENLPDEALQTLGAAKKIEINACNLAVRYACHNQPTTPLYALRLRRSQSHAHLVLDEAAVRNLELVRTLSGEKTGSLLHFIDATQTPMGARLLRKRLLAPFADTARIRRCHDKVEELVLNLRLRQAIQEVLRTARDLERLSIRAAMGNAFPRDLAGIRGSLRAASEISRLIQEHATQEVESSLSELIPKDPCTDVQLRLDHELTEEPATTVGSGGIFRAGVYPDLDELHDLASRGRDRILELESRERELTGITSLKIRYTKVFGYYIEVTRSNLKSVPDRYHRKQTVAGGERFVTEELQSLEERIAQAEEQARELEQDLFSTLREWIALHVSRLQNIGSALAEVDLVASLAELAHRNNYVRPVIDDSKVLELIEARHPVVERLLSSGEFVPNDVTLDESSERLLIITGPNMAGKSTLLRQVAVAVILGQMGSFVPAKSARIGIVDRVFTRVGAADNLLRGDSTFMVEMKETATILQEATDRSLVVIDEIGRGTSTYDGVAIAWAVAEHLHNVVRARALCATHYHELCELTNQCSAAKNYNVAAREYAGRVVFLHKLVRGPASRSYGVAVAELAGLPALVIARARAILGDLESRGAKTKARQLELGLTPDSEAEKMLRSVDPHQLTPVQAIVMLEHLKTLLREPTESTNS